jgi:hypothetical protein
MNKKLLLVPLVASVLAACSSAPKDNFENRAYQERKYQERLAENAIDKAPEWMTKLPKSTSAIYANGTSTSSDMAMSTDKAKTVAFGKICMAAGGRVNQHSRLFRREGAQNTDSEFSEMAIKSFCPNVDITGVEVVESKMIAEGSRFRTFVLVALPTGDANPLARERDRREETVRAERRAQEAFRELDRMQDQGVSQPNKPDTAQ